MIRINEFKIDSSVYDDGIRYNLWFPNGYMINHPSLRFILFQCLFILQSYDSRKSK